MVALGPGVLGRGQGAHVVLALVVGDAHVGLEGVVAGRVLLRLHGALVREGRLGDLVVAVDLVLVGGGAVDDLDIADLGLGVVVVVAVADLELRGVDGAPLGGGSLDRKSVV